VVPPAGCNAAGAAAAVVAVAAAVLGRLIHYVSVFHTLS